MNKSVDPHAAIKLLFWAKNWLYLWILWDKLMIYGCLCKTFHYIRCPCSLCSQDKKHGFGWGGVFVVNIKKCAMKHSSLRWLKVGWMKEQREYCKFSFSHFFKNANSTSDKFNKICYIVILTLHTVYTFCNEFFNNNSCKSYTE